MQAFNLCCVCFLLADISLKTEAAGPTWITSATQSVDASGSGFCDFVAEMEANSGDGTVVSFSIESQTPDGGFDVHVNSGLGRFELRCNETLIVQEQYEVMAKAIQAGNNEFSELNITITFSGITPATPPSCTQTSISLTLDTSDSTACDSVSTLSCTSTDGSSVTYSLISQSPDGGFSVSGTTLICVQNSLQATTYTVTVRAQNTGNSLTSNIDFTITASSSASNGSGSGSNANNGSGSGSNSNNNNSTGKIVGGVIGGVAGVAVVVLIGFVIYKVFVSSKHPPGDINGR